MRIPLYQVDAFAERPFEGNPAAVCLLDAWLPDDVMQSIAAENNLSETAFLVNEGASFGLRWFTPKTEVDLCGHATLASGYVVFTHVRPDADVVRFSTLSGDLTVERDGERLVLDFPVRPVEPFGRSADLAEALGREPLEVHANAHAYLALVEDEAVVRSLVPRMDRIAGLDRPYVMVTAPGDSVDFVSRFFAPAAGVPEDPVTGSAHCSLAPFWAGRLGRPRLAARQLSERGGALECELRGDRVRIAGRAVPFLEGTLRLD